MWWPRASLPPLLTPKPEVLSSSPPSNVAPEARRGKLLPKALQPEEAARLLYPAPASPWGREAPLAWPVMWNGAQSPCPPLLPHRGLGAPRRISLPVAACPSHRRSLCTNVTPAPAGAGGSRSVGVASAPSASVCWQPEAELTALQVVLLFIHPFVYPLIPYADTHSVHPPVPAACCPVRARGDPGLGQVSVPRSSGSGAGSPEQCLPSPCLPVWVR